MRLATLWPDRPLASVAQQLRVITAMFGERADAPHLLSLAQCTPFAPMLTAPSLVNETQDLRI